MVAPTYYWYDYETFGIHPALDRPAQFAGIRTDTELNILGKPLLIYNQLTDDYLPDPAASRVTGITPERVNTQGLDERIFIQKIQAELSVAATCNTGYNSIRFDDEFTRHTLFRNFYDPYEHEWKNGNSRWDLLDVVRLARALRPAGIVWPHHADGKPSNRLEDLTQANGIAHEDAHDALADVIATIAVAKLLRDRQPKLYEYAYRHRSKSAVNDALNLRLQNAVVHISGMIPGEFGHCAIVAPIARHPTNSNGIIVLDLRFDPAELESLDAEQIRHRVFTPQVNLVPGESRLHLKTVHVNRSPVLVPLNTLTEEAAERLHINLEQSLQHLKTLQEIKGLTDKVIDALKSTEHAPVSDLDASLYAGGFFSDSDKRRFTQIRTADATTLQTLVDCFDDDRGDEMLFRYRARNYPDSLNAEERSDWQEHCQRRLNTPLPLAKGTQPLSYRQRFENALSASDWPAAELPLQKSLRSHADLVAERQGL